MGGAGAADHDAHEDERALEHGGEHDDGRDGDERAGGSEQREAQLGEGDVVRWLRGRRSGGPLLLVSVRVRARVRARARVRDRVRVRV